MHLAGHATAKRARIVRGPHQQATRQPARTLLPILPGAVALRGHSSGADAHFGAQGSRPGAAGETRAIETVLDAERVAEEAVGEAEAEAERLLSDARDHARRIGERADERIRQIHTRSAMQADRTIEQLYAEHEDRARESQQSLSDPDRVRIAAEDVADWLLGEDAR